MCYQTDVHLNVTQWFWVGSSGYILNIWHLLYKPQGVHQHLRATPSTKPSDEDFCLTESPFAALNLCVLLREPTVCVFLPETGVACPLPKLSLLSSPSSSLSLKSSRFPMSFCLMLMRLARLCMSSSLWKVIEFCKNPWCWVHPLLFTVYM